MLLTGAQVPMQRSFATAVLVTLALLTGRQAVSMRSLALAAAAVMLISPAALLGPSFQMSFAAVLALIAGWEALRPRMMRLRGDGDLVAAGRAVRGWRWSATSVLAGLATAPVRPAPFRAAAMVRRGGECGGGAADLRPGDAGRHARGAR